MFTYLGWSVMEINSIEKPARPELAFADALRAAIDRRGVTLSWLISQLRDLGSPVSSATLSYWRSGARRPEGAQSLAAIAAIEELLHLRSGALRTLVGPTHRIGPFGAPQFPLNQNPIEKAVFEVFSALGEDNPDRARDVSTQSVTLVGADGNVASRTTRSLVQSASGIITDIPYVEMSPGVRTPPPEFRAVAGATLSEVYSHPSGEVHGFNLRLETPIDTAETTLIEWTMDVPDGYPPTRETGHGVSRPCRELLLWTRFHPDAVPDWADEREDTPSGVIVSPVTIGGTSVHQVRRRFGPGLLALEWGYHSM